MADEEELNEEEGSEEGSPQKKGKLILIIIIAAVLLISSIAGAYFFFFRGPPKEEVVEPAEGEDAAPAEGDEGAPAEGDEGETTKTTSTLKEGIIFPLEHFIVNINDDTGAIRYLKVEIKLELENDEMQAEVENRVPKIRDSIVTILTNKSVDSVSRPDGKLRLKEEIKARINTFITMGKIEEIYFTDFIIQ